MQIKNIYYITNSFVNSPRAIANGGNSKFKQHSGADLRSRYKLTNDVYVFIIDVIEYSLYSK